MIVKAFSFVPFLLLGITVLLVMRALYKEDWSERAERRIFFAAAGAIMSGLLVSGLIFFGVVRL